ncbi:hypothetical protein Aperf_G00000046206 [Anoplocephala perfoliata]
MRSVHCLPLDKRSEYSTFHPQCSKVSVSPHPSSGTSVNSSSSPHEFPLRVSTLKAPSHRKNQHQYNSSRKIRGRTALVRNGQRQTRRHYGGIQSPSSDAGLREAWQASQNVIASLRNENHLLQCQLKNCQEELKTVQRQCKVQNARLTKAIGRESDTPTTIDRLNAEVRALQIHLRRQREATKSAEKRAIVAEARLAEKREYKTTNPQGPNAISTTDADASARNEIRKRAIAAEAPKAEVEEEKQKIKELLRKVEMMEWNHRAEQNSAIDQIRKLRKFCNDLQAQLETTTRSLQEKTKLLELQNIYSQRLPKSVILQNAGLEFSRKAGCEINGEEALQSHSTNRRLARCCQPPPPLSAKANSMLEKRRGRTRAAGCSISGMVAKMKSGFFSRPYVSNAQELCETPEYKSFPNSVINRNGCSNRSPKLDFDTDLNAQAFLQVKERRERENGEDDLINIAVKSAVNSTGRDEEAIPESQENDNFTHKTIGSKRDLFLCCTEPVSVTEIITSIKEDAPDTIIPDTIIHELKAERKQISECHNSPQNKGDDITSINEAVSNATHLESIPWPEDTNRSTGSREELLWESIFGKKESEDSTTSQYVPTAIDANDKKTFLNSRKATGGDTLRQGGSRSQVHLTSDEEQVESEGELHRAVKKDKGGVEGRAVVQVGAEQEIEARGVRKRRRAQLVAWTTG